MNLTKKSITKLFAIGIGFAVASCSQVVYRYKTYDNSNFYLLSNGKKIIAYSPGQSEFPIINDFGDTLFIQEGFSETVTKSKVKKSGMSFNYNYSDKSDTIKLASGIQAIGRFPCLIPSPMHGSHANGIKLRLTSCGPGFQNGSYFIRYIGDTTYVSNSYNRAYAFEFYPNHKRTNDTIGLFDPINVVISEQGIPLSMTYLNLVDSSGTCRTQIYCDQIKTLKGRRRQIMNHLL